MKSKFLKAIFTTLPGKPPETLTAEIGCFRRSVFTGDPPHNLADLHSTEHRATHKPGTDQSGTIPNLVAKIWPLNSVTICAWLPILVANVSSNFHHLVNTGLAVGSLFKWLPITVAHTCKLETIRVFYISPIGNGSIRL